MLHVIPKQDFYLFSAIHSKSKNPIPEIVLFERQNGKLSLKPMKLLEVFTRVSLTEFNVMC